MVRTDIGGAGNLVMVERFDQENLRDGFANGHIRFDRTNFSVSNMDGLTGAPRAYTTNAMRQTAEGQLAQVQNDNPNWASHLATATLAVTGFIPTTAVASGVVGAGHGAWTIIDDFAGRGQALSQAQQNFYHQMAAVSVSDIGGGVASVHLPNGNYRVIGTTLSTQAAMINLAGLETQGISNETALAALADSNHPTYSAVQEFLNNAENIRARFINNLPAQSEYIGGMPLHELAHLLEPRGQ